MELRELTGPYEKRNIITYKRDNTTAVVKRIPLQHIAGPVYRDADKKDKYKQVYCHIYVYFDALQIGVDIGGIMNPGLRTVDTILDSAKKQLLETPEMIIADMDRAVDEKRFIANAWIEFARYAAPDRVETYQRARLDYLAELERKRAERQAALMAEETKRMYEKNEAAQRAVDQAMEVMRSDGKLLNECITICRAAYTSSDYKLVNYIARQLGVDIPLKVQGWINSKLVSVEIKGGRVNSFSYYGKPSKTFAHYMEQMIGLVRAAPGRTVLVVQESHK